ncbi:MAG: GNAT family N-acetyltransferase [candidate division NC10 bacterium]|nr:GNAT family N-acetyltransferase [candidate division NC10 bacterium]
MPDMLVRLYALPDQNTILKDGYVVRRAAAYEKAVILQWIGQHFSTQWASEADVAFSRQPISCFLALAQERLVGFACYEATCLGYFGPGGVLEAHRGQGLGTRLLLECLRAMKEMGYTYAIIGRVGPKEFYAKTVGAIEIPDSTPGIYTAPLDALHLTSDNLEGGMETREKRE